jgi:2-haloacid dehalogenase
MLSGIRACVFDAYGTLFDVSSIARAAQDEIGEAWQPLSELWRAKQLQYTWLRGLAGHHADFWQVTGDALDFAMDSVGLTSKLLRERLLNRYLQIDAYPDVAPTLQHLKSRGMKLAILSNGTPRMLAAAVTHAQLDGCFDAILSVEEAGIYKPHSSVYRLAPERLELRTDEICFLSSNGWDAYSAKAFGFRVLWCNRSGQQAERIPAQPDGEIPDLVALAAWFAPAIPLES